MIDNKFNIGDKVVLRGFGGYCIVKGIQVDATNILLYVVGGSKSCSPSTSYNALEAELKLWVEPIKPVLNKFNLNDLVTIEAPARCGTVYYVHGILQHYDKSRAYYSLKTCDGDGKIYNSIREVDMRIYVRNHA
jgi:hypothetical protein